MEKSMNTVNETTVSSEPEKQQEEFEVNEPVTEPQEQETDDDTSAQGTDGNQSAADDGTQSTSPFLEIRYNHESRELTRDEAVTLAQKGLHYQSTYDSLERVAALKGQTVKEFLNGLESAQDEAYRQGLIEKFGDDEDTIGRLMELYNINKQKTIDNAKANQKAAAEQEEQTINERLAQEFVEMKNGDFPELTEFKDLPEEVKRAAFEGLSLSHAYLKHMHNENKKIAAEKASQEAAAKKSTGSMASDELTDFVGDAFLRGILGKN